MAEFGANARPIVIKRKKVSGGGGHHGGAWKVAYADFVTAMMAFFLLMWLLNATTEDQRKGLADYFSDTIPIARVSGGGTGAFSGETLSVDRSQLAESGGGVAQISRGRASGRGENSADTDQTGASEGEGGDGALEQVEGIFRSFTGESDAADPAFRHVRVRTTETGLVIELFDTADRPLFDLGSADATPMLRALATMVADVAGLVSNPIEITGHTDATPLDVDGDDGNWALSAERAQTARRLLLAAGLDERRMAAVAGKAATEPAVEDPLDPRNRRVEITLMRVRP